jgi:hypothetical protein
MEGSGRDLISGTTLDLPGGIVEIDEVPARIAGRLDRDLNPGPSEC